MLPEIYTCKYTYARTLMYASPPCARTHTYTHKRARLHAPVSEIMDNVTAQMCTQWF